MLSCSICQDGINENPKDKNYPWVLSCGHVYHKLCINQSLNINNSCPQCRKPVTKSFRLFPEVLNSNESFTFLQECVQNAETQYERQKKTCQDKDYVIQGLQTALEDNESKNTSLRTSYINYTNTVQIQTEKFNAEVKTLQNDKIRLNAELNKSVEKVVRHESTISDLQRKLQNEKDLFISACNARREATTSHHQQINTLKAELDKVKQDSSELDRVRIIEINQLRAKLNKQQAEITTAKEIIEDLTEREPIARRPDSAVDDLAQVLERIALPQSRKRRSTNEDTYSPWFSAKEETSVKQQRSESGDETPPLDGDTNEGGGVEAENESFAARVDGESRPKTRTRRRVRRVLRVVKVGDAQ